MKRRGMSQPNFERLIGFARDMRKEPAPAEKLLWSRLRDRQLRGFKWRRQQPRDGFIADFYCAECRLIVELDGDSHVGDGVAESEHQADADSRA